MDQAAGVLLAAGGGRRYGGPKALLPFDGALLVERGARMLAAAGCAPVVVVLGAAADEVRARADLRGAQIVVNADWPTGIGSSLRAGLGALRPGVTAAVVVLVDQPGVTAAAVARVVAAAPPTGATVADYGGWFGHPVLLARDTWAAVAGSAVGDRGARAYLRAHPDAVVRVPCADVGTADDIDTPADLARLRPADG